MSEAQTPPNKPRIGRPRIYEHPEDMAEAVADYFETCERNNEKPLVTGLCLHLGFSCRETLDEYQRRPAFTDIVKRARTLVEHRYEHDLDKDKPTGAIFALKNMGWKDGREVSVHGQIAHIDPTRLTDEQLQRISRGENPLAVLATPQLEPAIEDAEYEVVEERGSDGPERGNSEP